MRRTSGSGLQNILAGGGSASPSHGSTASGHSRRQSAPASPSSRPPSRAAKHLPASIPPARFITFRPQLLRLTLLLALLVLITLALLQAQSPSTAGSDSANSPSHYPHLTMPNFDFDIFRSTKGDESLEVEEDPLDREEVDEERDASKSPVEVVEEVEKENADGADALDDDTPPQDSENDSTSQTPLPFLSYTCPASLSSNTHSQPTSALPTFSKYSKGNVLDPAVLDRAVVFAGSGSEVRRVLKRAAKSALYSAKRKKEKVANPNESFEDEEPFRILVLGGSVSNCRGVNKASCWHSRTESWFNRYLPMEGDARPRPDPEAWVKGPSRLNKRFYSPPPPNASDLAYSSAEKRQIQKKPREQPLVASAPPGNPEASARRIRSTTRVMNAAKSATGSAFYAYCYEAELANRKQMGWWGPGPDLVVLEFGVNDVYPTTEAATKDFEKLLFHLRSLPTKPAIIILEAASLLLAQTSPAHTNAEYLHLPAAHFYDVPVLSAKHALMGPHRAFLPGTALGMEDLFLPDQHHFNEKGHEFLSDVLTAYLERQMCDVQAGILDTATRQLRTFVGTSRAARTLEPERDVEPRRDEKVLPLPTRSLFTPFSTLQSGKKDKAFSVPKPTCLQIGHSAFTIEPLANKGWSKYSWARDKQYMIANVPGSVLTYEVTIGSGGEILLDWLRSRFYDLGDVLVYLDNKKRKGVTLSGYWDLGWSIGVPTTVFTRVSPGKHTVSIELLSASKSSHPNKQTNFRLIGLITT